MGRSLSYSFRNFKKNLILGSGLGTFRYICSDKAYENIKSKIFRSKMFNTSP